MSDLALRYKRYAKTISKGLRRLLGGAARPPDDDPYSYVTAPKRPRLPGRSAAAVAERPE